MDIRSATVSDAADIARIHVETWRAAYAGIVPEAHLAQLSEEAGAQRWVKLLTQGTREARVAVDHVDRVVGWASFGPSRDEDGHGVGEIYAIYIDQPHWGAGIGTALVEDAVRRLELGAFGSVTLWVLEENARARRFYDKVGFGFDGTSKVIEIGGSGLMEVRYKRAVAHGASQNRGDSARSS